MPEYSRTIELALQIGALEAHSSGSAYLEREHVFISLCKIDEVLAQMKKQSPGIVDAGMEDEVAGVVSSFNEHKLDRVKLRRRVRQLVGHGAANLAEGDTMHRSESCRRSFEAAEKLASGQNSEVTTLYLLAGILQNPGPRIAQAIVSAGVNLDGFVATVTKAAHDLTPQLAGQVATQQNSRSYLARYGTDLTQLARDGKMEPLIGRRQELVRLMRTLSRKTKNNPLLIGDPGVGKTAVVRGLAQRIAEGKVINELRQRSIIELNLGTIVAGTKYRGEFEERITKLVQEAAARPEVILFIDEIHTMVGAGSAEGSLDAANILKPALSNGEIHCIGSTTVTEFRKYFEKDAALARRFQPLFVEEPSAEETIEILRGLKSRYEKHHGLTIDAEVLGPIVDMCVRYLPDRKLPDKAIDLLDESCTRLKVSSVKADDVLGPLNVTAEVAAKVLSDWTGIPVGRLSAAKQEALQDIEAVLSRRVIGQPFAVSRVSQVVKIGRAGLRDPRRPLGVFLFLGPTGVGKTELSKALAEFLFGSEKEIVRLDMSEYAEKHTVSRLIGAPPGYVGHEEEGQLTGRLRRKPHSIVLLDEIEKAHADVFDLFLQLFDEGRLTDSHGRTVDGKNAIFIMTSNIAAAPPGAHKPIGFGADPAQSKQPQADMKAAALQELRRFFRPEFLNRIDEIVQFERLGKRELGRIARKLLDELKDRALEQDIIVQYAEDAIECVVGAGYDQEYGARPMARAVERLVARPLSDKMVSQEFHSGDIILVSLGADGKLSFEKSEHDPTATV